MKLYPSTASAFTNNGLGALSDAISCNVTEELNGVFEMEMQYPITGLHFSDILLRNIITAKTNPTGDPQPFRIYRITKPLNGRVTIFARHIAYDMGGLTVEPFEASSLGQALQMLPSKSVTTCPFTFGTDKTVATGYTVQLPASMWSLLGGTSGSILDRYGGEWEFNKFSAYLWNRRGADRGVTIRYGKNMTNLEQDSNCASVYTGIYPYWTASEGDVLVTLQEKIVNAPGTYDFVKIQPVNFTDSFDAQPTEEQLRARAQRYINENNIGIPDVSWSVEFEMLEQSDEYKDKALLERVYLGDTVSVYFEKLGVSASARAVKIVYDALLDRYDTVTLGKVKSNLAQTIVNQQKAIDEKPSRTIITGIVEKLTKGILGALGGAVRLLDTNGDGMPDELYIADNEDPALATKVWRWNYQGWAASKTGYTGPFTMGATLEDGLLADFVTAAHLTAGTIESEDGQSFYLNLDENILRMGVVTELESNMNTRFTNVQNDIDVSVGEANDRTDGLINNLSGSVDQRIATEATNTDAKIANATDGISDHIDDVEAGINAKLIPLSEISDYIQVGNIGTEQSPLFGVKIGKRDLATAFKSIFTASALEFYENNVKTAFLSNQKLNTNTIRTAAMELVSSANMGDAQSVDWLVTMDNGFTIKYVGGDS